MAINKTGLRKQLTILFLLYIVLVPIVAIIVSKLNIHSQFIIHFIELLLVTNLVSKFNKKNKRQLNKSEKIMVYIIPICLTSLTFYLSLLVTSKTVNPSHFRTLVTFSVPLKIFMSAITINIGINFGDKLTKKFIIQDTIDEETPTEDLDTSNLNGPWKCKCGQHHEEDVAICWKCGTREKELI